MVLSLLNFFSEEFQLIFVAFDFCIKLFHGSAEAILLVQSFLALLLDQLMFFLYRRELVLDFGDQGLDV